ncbi:MBOAT, membrane-bound O-acyltransferase family-domain-containing protein [Entophlyctis helioformis]|nr:MBOAT, membrane-bound O-acyltransferase family-domain-containing protein [Entophlyctis helioformis]
MGLVILSQVCLVLFIATSIHAHWFRTGTLFDPVVFSLVFGQTGAVLGTGLRLLVSSAGVVGVQMALASGWLAESASMSAWVLWESSWLSYWVLAIGSSQLSWVQRLVLCVFMIALLMKQHSYTAINNELRRAAIAAPAPAIDSKPSNPADPSPPVSFASSITLSSFTHFLISPNLVYAQSVPLIPHFRIKHFAYYAVWTLISAFGLYITLDHIAYPAVRDIKANGYYHTFGFLVPAMVLYVTLVFLTLFEYLCNALAEIARLDERDFYGDWWNAKGYEDFSRKYSTVVHKFLHRHVYKESVEHFKLSRPYAMIFTFVVSAFFQELVMLTVLGTFQTDLFRMQVMQVLYIWMDYKMPPSRDSYGVFGFFGGYFLGPPMIAIAYGRSYFE